MSLKQILRSGSYGFTMIELLVVIAIIGVLAAAVLSAINPVEQISKGRDTRYRSDAAELINAAERYFAVQEEWPWNTNNVGVWEVTGGATDPDSEFSQINPNGSDLGWLSVMETTDEIKPGFAARMRKDASEFIIYKGNGTAPLTVCFAPNSRQFRQEAYNRCANDPDSLPGGSSGASFGGGTPPFDSICPIDDPDLNSPNYICVP